MKAKRKRISRSDSGRVSCNRAESTRPAPKNPLLTASNQAVYTSHQLMSSEMQPEIDSAEICERLVGITPIYLQNFVQRGRGRYGLKASAQAGKWRERRRLFSRDDVFGIALVWLLFESGLRSDPIIRILKEIAGTKQPKANL